MNSKLSDTQIIGFMLMVSFLSEAEKKVGAEHLKGSFLWARHKSDPEFASELEDLPAGTSGYDRDKTWYLAFVPAVNVPLPPTAIGNCVLLSVFVEGTEKTALLTMEQIRKLAKEIPEGHTEMNLVTVNAKGSTDGSSN